jgi:hypothetical protein
MQSRLSDYDTAIELDVAAGSESVGVIERKIRTVKERLRGYITIFPFATDEILEEWLVKNVVYYLNWTPTTNSIDGRSPLEKLTGRNIDARSDLRHGFGDYVQIGDGETGNNMEERTRGAIALMPASNRDGSWYYLVLKSWRTVKRNKATTLPMPDEVIDYIEGKARMSRQKRKIGDTLKIGLWRSDNNDTYTNVADDIVLSEEEPILELREQENNEIEGLQPAYVEPDCNGYITMEEQYDGNQEEEIDYNDEEARKNLINEIFGEDSDNDVISVVAESIGDIGDNDVVDDSVGFTNEDVAMEKEKDVTEEMAAVEIGSTDGPISRYNLRERRAKPGDFKRMTAIGVKRNSLTKAFMKRKFGLNMTIRQGINKLGYEAVLSVVKEIMQLHDTGTFTGVDVTKLSEKAVKSIITSSMFLKDKYTADGVFEKLKARLVAGGHLMDRTIYDNGGSPTATTQSVFMVACLAAKEGRKVAHIDFPGAFLYAEMPEDDNKPVYMRLNRFETSVLVKVDPSYGKFVLNNGTCVVRLKRALYGCVESARMWYEKLSNDLLTMGYVKDQHDMCVFNRVENDGSQSTLVVHVDDVLVTARTNSLIDNIIQELEKSYKKLSIQRGDIINYIGMVFDFRVSGKCKITMEGFMDDLMNMCEKIQGIAKTPATDQLFKISDNEELLDKEKREFFHSLTAKFLYLAKRVRPDILTAVSFLVKRVNNPTGEDLRKLERLVRYVRGTKELGIVLEASKILGVYGCIDASYGVHNDMKSHSGCIIGIGKGPVYAKSGVQKLNTKSSSEAELVALSDHTNQVIWTRNFLLDQGYDVGASKVYQDNQSTIAMVKNGRSNSARTRHIAIRFYFVADRVASKEISVEYMRTGDMVADILTKPLQGQLFIRLRELLLNWSS